MIDPEIEIRNIDMVVVIIFCMMIIATISRVSGCIDKKEKDYINETVLE